MSRQPSPNQLEQNLPFVEQGACTCSCCHIRTRQLQVHIYRCRIPFNIRPTRLHLPEDFPKSQKCSYFCMMRQVPRHWEDEGPSRGSRSAIPAVANHNSLVHSHNTHAPRPHPTSLFDCLNPCCCRRHCLVPPDVCIYVMKIIAKKLYDTASTTGTGKAENTLYRYTRQQCLHPSNSQ